MISRKTYNIELIVREGDEKWIVNSLNVTGVLKTLKHQLAEKMLLERDFNYQRPDVPHRLRERVPVPYDPTKVPKLPNTHINYDKTLHNNKLHTCYEVTPKTV
jgi:hypothetical protein